MTKVTGKRGLSALQVESLFLYIDKEQEKARNSSGRVKCDT